MHQSSNSNRIHKTQVHQANGAQINYKVHMSKWAEEKQIHMDSRAQMISSNILHPWGKVCNHIVMYRWSRMSRCYQSLALSLDWFTEICLSILIIQFIVDKWKNVMRVLKWWCQKVKVWTEILMEQWVAWVMECLETALKETKTWQNLGMDMEYNIGQMEHIMKETGCLTKQKDKEHSGMLRVMFIEVNLKTTWPMDMENILI